jgi:hypothetical protein
VRLASRGLRDMDSGEQKVENQEEAAQIRKQARKVHLQALGSAVLVAALATVIRIPR